MHTSPGKVNVLFAVGAEKEGRAGGVNGVDSHPTMMGPIKKRKKKATTAKESRNRTKE